MAFIFTVTRDGRALPRREKESSTARSRAESLQSRLETSESQIVSPSAGLSVNLTVRLAVIMQFRETLKVSACCVQGSFAVTTAPSPFFKQPSYSYRMLL